MAMGASLTEYSRSLWRYLFQRGFMLTNEVEVVARFEQSFGIGHTDPALLATIRTRGNQFGAGLNWYVAGHGLKVQADYHYLYGDIFDRGRHQFRLQLQASF